jgi:hypothetical protein
LRRILLTAEQAPAVSTLKSGIRVSTPSLRSKDCAMIASGREAKRATMTSADMGRSLTR